jgi:antitoxin (DNA-binding transcriptional repressor) of toxin-antitoxin stability system
MKANNRRQRYRMKDVLSAVERGESVTVPYRGKPKARILPIDREPGGATLAEAAVFGMWKDREDLRDVPGYVRKVRAVRATPA